MDDCDESAAALDQSGGEGTGGRHPPVEERA
ncbi:hypothetical protein J2129_000540 [Methanofollis sp. W23]|nr:hypothetical protein [Methanofollis sp. W23]